LGVWIEKRGKGSKISYCEGIPVQSMAHRQFMLLRANVMYANDAVSSVGLKEKLVLLKYVTYGNCSSTYNLYGSEP
jgi:hypothetical protein